MIISLRRALRSKLLAETAVYGGLNVVRALIPVLLVPVLTRYLTPEDYGMVVLFEFSRNLGVQIFGLGTVSAVRRRFFDPERVEFGRYFSSALLANAFGFVVILLVIGLCTALGWGLPPLAMWALAPVIAGQVILALFLAVLQLHHRPVTFGLVMIANTLANLGLSVVFVVPLGWGWYGRVWAIVAAALGSAVLAVLLTWRRVGLARPDFRWMRDALNYGLPIIPNGLLSKLAAFADRVLVAALVSVSVAGVYAAAYQFAMVITMSVQSLAYAWTPWLFERLKREDAAADRSIVKATYASCAALTLIAVAAIFAVHYFAPWIVGRSFHGATLYTPWLLTSALLRGMSRVISTIILYSERTASLSLITVSVLVVNVLALVVLVPWVGPVGAAQASCLASFVGLVVTWRLASRFRPLPWLLRRHPAESID